MPPQPLDVVLGSRQARLQRTAAAFSTLHDLGGVASPRSLRASCEDVVLALAGLPSSGAGVLRSIAGRNRDRFAPLCFFHARRVSIHRSAYPAIHPRRSIGIRSRATSSEF